MEICSKFTTDDSAGQSLGISRDGIVHYVGTATESLIRILSDEKLLEIKDGKIRIQDISKLKIWHTDTNYQWVFAIFANCRTKMFQFGSRKPMIASSISSGFCIGLLG